MVATIHNLMNSCLGGHNTILSRRTLASLQDHVLATTQDRRPTASTDCSPRGVLDLSVPSHSNPPLGPYPSAAHPSTSQLNPHAPLFNPNPLSLHAETDSGDYMRENFDRSSNNERNSSRGRGPNRTQVRGRGSSHGTGDRDDRRGRGDWNNRDRHGATSAYQFPTQQIRDAGPVSYKNFRELENVKNQLKMSDKEIFHDIKTKSNTTKPPTVIANYIRVPDFPGHIYV